MEVCEGSLRAFPELISGREIHQEEMEKEDTKLGVTELKLNCLTHGKLVVSVLRFM